jgi:hypothetical protein
LLVFFSRGLNDETLLNFIERKHPRKGEKKETKGQGLKSKQANSPTKAGHKEEREPLRTKPSTSHMKQINERKGR